MSKTQEALSSFLAQTFEKIGEPNQIVTDNMKTMMDVARTEVFKGKPNHRFAKFAQDFGFEVLPCIAGRPRTKGRVESQMKLLDEIHAYQGQLMLLELSQLIQKVCERANQAIHQGTGKFPYLNFKKS